MRTNETPSPIRFPEIIAESTSTSHSDVVEAYTFTVASLGQK